MITSSSRMRVSLLRPAFRLLQRQFASGHSGNGSLHSLFISDVTTSASRLPLLLGWINYFERSLPSVGFFSPIGGEPYPNSTMGVDRHIELVHRVFGMKDDPSVMFAVTEDEASKAVTHNRTPELMDKIYASFQAYRADKDLVVVEGPGPRLGGTDMDAAIAETLSSPVLMTITTTPSMSEDDVFNLAMLKRQVFQEHRVEVVGVALNRVTPRLQQCMGQLRAAFEREGLAFAGGIPDDPLLASVRLDEVRAAVGAQVVCGCEHAGGGHPLDREYCDIIVASHRVEELLEVLDDRAATGAAPPLVVTSQDRQDIVLALVAAQVSSQGVPVSGVLLTQAGHAPQGHRYMRDVAARVMRGLDSGGGGEQAGALVGGLSHQGVILPVLATDKPMLEVLDLLRAQSSAILPTSVRKIQQSKTLFDRHVSAGDVLAQIKRALPRTNAMTPKMFIHNIKAQCKRDPQRIVLPEPNDPRVLAAAAEAAARGLAKVILLGDPQRVKADAQKLGLDLTDVTILNPQTSDRVGAYVDALMEARRDKGLVREQALDQVTHDINMFGVMMVACGDADGMVSGALHTTAATIRPAMQVLKLPNRPVVSSVFFMCLPDRVLVYGDCAINVDPTAKELAEIAVHSADTAAAFGVEPRVALLSYSTLGSGSGPDVEKVTEATRLVKAARPDIKVEGPIQYDAAIDPKVAAVKVKGSSEVAGKATVFVFPNLNTGNNTYKAVQQASGAIAMGPVMQGLSKPVNDLSRGCTVPDIVNTIAATSIQAQFDKARATKQQQQAASQAA